MFPSFLCHLHHIVLAAFFMSFFYMTSFQPCFGRVPDEYESGGGHSLPMAGGGMAAAGGHQSIRLNPAMIAVEKTYSLIGAYHWPSKGRNFYQGGIVDSSTSSFAAGISYTGFMDTYEEFKKEELLNGRSDDAEWDSPLINRGLLALAYPFRLVSMGLGISRVKGYRLSLESEEEAQYNQIAGQALNLGLAGLITPQLRFGLSAENIANRQIQDFAPRTYRAGLAYVALGGQFTAHLDLRQREKIESFENPQVSIPGLNLNDTSHQKYVLDKPHETMAVGSFSILAYDVLRFLGGYGKGINVERESAGLGVALIGTGFNFSYSLYKPYLNEGRTHQGLALSIDMKT